MVNERPSATTTTGPTIDERAEDRGGRRDSSMGGLTAARGAHCVHLSARSLAWSMSPTSGGCSQLSPSIALYPGCWGVSRLRRCGTVSVDPGGIVGRIGLRYGAAGFSLLAVLGSVATSAEASTAIPGPPTAVHAVFGAGVNGTAVSWSAPASHGGSPILYYLASNYTGSHWCLSPNPGPDTCHIDGLKNGTTAPTIRVRAVSASGRGAVAVTLPVRTQGDLNGSSGSTLGATSTGAAAASPSVYTSTSAASASLRSGGQLPFTGADLEALFALGMSMVLVGVLLQRPRRHRRRADGLTAALLLDQ